MAPTYGWTADSSSKTVIISSRDNNIAEDISNRLKKTFLLTLCKRPTMGMTEVRRDGKDNAAVANVIKKEFMLKMDVMDQQDFIHHMHTYASACWAATEAVHQVQLEDEIPENERARLDPDHWYEINLTNATLFSNLFLEHVPGLEQLVPGRLFSTRMPRDIVVDLGERTDFIKKCEKNKLRVVFVLTESHEFKKYSGMDGLLDFYKQECRLVVYNRAIPDFQIPTQGDLVNNILDLVYHLSQGRNCLVHCAGGTGRTGMVLAAIIQNLGVYDPVNRIRKVKSTYVETKEQETFLKNMPRAIDGRIVAEKPHLARAIAAEHLIQVFFTHKDKIEKQNTKEGKESTRQSFLGDNVEPLDQKEEDDLLEAYRQTFDLIDADHSGTLEREELEEWFKMVGAELDLSKLVDTLVGDVQLTREKFAKLMCSSAKSHRRDYDIGDDGEQHEH